LNFSEKIEELKEGTQNSVNKKNKNILRDEENLTFSSPHHYW
jgi:hypothetical protein